MTTTELDRAAMWRTPVIMPNLLVPLMKPMEIIGLTKRYRSEEESLRHGGAYYYEVILRDAGGRGQIVASPNQVEPADPDAFARQMAWYEEVRRKGGGTDGR